MLALKSFVEKHKNLELALAWGGKEVFQRTQGKSHLHDGAVGGGSDPHARTLARVSSKKRSPAAATAAAAPQPPAPTAVTPPPRHEVVRKISSVFMFGAALDRFEPF